MSNKPMLGLQFFGTATPFIVTKIKPTTPYTFARTGFELFSRMEGTVQMYYVAGLPEPLTRRNMVVSIFLTQLVRKFKRLAPDDEQELWVYFGTKEDVKRITNP